MKRFLIWVWPAFAFLILMGGVVEAVVRWDIVPSYLLPAPSQVFEAMIENREDLAQALGGTWLATAQGLLIGLILGQGLALLLNLFGFLKRALFPIAVFFQTVPIIAIAPLIVIWFGFGSPTVRASAAIVCFFPILSNALVGLESAKRELLELFRVLGASRWQTLVRLQIPSSFRTNIAGLKVAAGLAVVGAIVGEFVGGGGLGSLIDSARTQQRTDIVFACVILSSLLGLLLVGLVSLLERALCAWRPFNEN
ncbi:MAG: ABC transporter permease [Bdellovibrionaceae bacterium]|nr:ABC transporter permease [Pseudobdellovibrionaceae bacterium]